MPLEQKPIIHGRDHLPGHPDPIPGLTLGAGDFETVVLSIPDLFAYWRLGEPSSPWADTSGVAPQTDLSETGSGAALTPDVTGALPAGQDDGALELNYDGVAESGGRSAQSSGADKDFAFTGTGEMSVCAWVKVKASALTRRGLIIGQSNWSIGLSARIGWGLQVIYPARTVRFTYGQPGGGAEVYAETAGGVVAGEWNLFVGTYDGTTIRLYANGILVDSATGSYAPSGHANVNVGLGFDGASSSTNAAYLYGTVDEAAVWTRAIDPDEIAELSASGTDTIGPDGIADGSIFDRHVNTAADIDPTKLDHPGGTTDYLRADGTWATPPGTGGGGIPATIADAKGDLIAASANDTVARLAVGSNDQILVADSGQTLGVKWAAVPGTSAFVPVSTIDAKGDLLVGSANDAIDNLAVGSNDQVLTADSGQTLGVKWATPASGSVATDTLWDAKGDLAVASASDAADNLTVGSNNQVLTADSSQTLGVKWATPATGGAVVLLSTTTLGSNNTFDVSSISGAYNDLILVLIARLTDAGANDRVNFRLNNDSAGNYYGERFSVNNAALTGANMNGTTSWQVATYPAAGASSGFFGISELTLYGYASTAWRKAGQWHSSGTDGTAASASTVQRGGGFWNSTAAITRVQLFGNTTANFLTGSELRIYGRL